MTYKDNAVKDLRIAYIGGGSRGWAWTFIQFFAENLVRHSRAGMNAA